ncbi:sensor domain-containing protein [Mycobacteroides salmoniphilum]|uniref:sensor domain-containing protein n=1 Tax=Mycobacteroides salmoniphilum TaxID=404941 RepID=UPI0010AAEF04|nr:sensor domain-containing protein [Mycobacteroides salmoniphilum]
MVPGAANVGQGHVGSAAEILPDDAQMSSLLALRLHSDTRIDRLDLAAANAHNADTHTSSAECLGVALPSWGTTLGQAPVRQAIQQQWSTRWKIRGTGTGTAVEIQIVELESPSSARTWFTTLEASWRRCQDKPFTTKGPGTGAVTNLEVKSVAEDPVSSDFMHAIIAESTGPQHLAPRQTQRAAVQTSQYIIDVSVHGHSDTTSDKAQSVARLVKANATA